jgi:hypothetical protein
MAQFSHEGVDIGGPTEIKSETAKALTRTPKAFRAGWHEFRQIGQTGFGTI